MFHPRYNGTNNRILYAGNDGGIFRTRDALAAALKRSNGDTLLFAFTYGRGAWKVKLGS